MTSCNIFALFNCGEVLVSPSASTDSFEGTAEVQDLLQTVPHVVSNMQGPIVIGRGHANTEPALQKQFWIMCQVFCSRPEQPVL